MRLSPALMFVVLCVGACGGSASETPFPEEPLPDYVIEQRKAKAAEANAAPSAKGAVNVSTPSASSGKPVAPSADPAKPAGAAPAF
jgi:hypothetical protein